MRFEIKSLYPRYTYTSNTYIYVHVYIRPIYACIYILYILYIHIYTYFRHCCDLQLHHLDYVFVFFFTDHWRSVARVIPSLINREEHREYFYAPLTQFLYYINVLENAFLFHAVYLKKYLRSCTSDDCILTRFN